MHNFNKKTAIKQHTSCLGKVLPDGTMLEAIYNPQSDIGQFIVYKDNKTSVQSEYLDEVTGKAYLPLIDNNIKVGAVRLATENTPLISEEDLLGKIQAFIHQHVDISPGFEGIAARYVLLTYKYDKFQEIPYLRVLGPYGTGKSRFLHVMSSICYHSYKLGASATAAAMFRTVDKYRGTLILEEANFKDSSRYAAAIQILTSGNSNEEGFITRCQPSDYEPVTYRTFSPKILASHEPFKDSALESRFITCITKRTKREDILLYLPHADKWKEAIVLRNQLLQFRLRNYAKFQPALTGTLDQTASRYNQIIQPIFEVMGEKKVPSDIQPFLEEMRDQNQNSELLSDENIVIATVLEMSSNGNTLKVSPGEISDYIKSKTKDDISPRKIGSILRTQGIRSHRQSRGIIYNLTASEINRLRDQYN